MLQSVQKLQTKNRLKTVARKVNINLLRNDLVILVTMQSKMHGFGDSIPVLIKHGCC